MPISAKKTFRNYYVINLIAFFICINLVIFLSPLKQVVTPHLLRFVEANIDIIVNLLVISFMIGAALLAFIVWWVNWADEGIKTRARAYVSQLVAKDYYKGNRKIDFYRAVKSSLSKFSRDDVAEEARIEDDKKTGREAIYKVRKKFQNIKTQVIKEAENEDKSDGTHKIRYPNGALKKEVTYKNGKEDGVCRTFYEDGVLHQEIHFKDGLMHGLYKAYDEFGVPFFEIHYKEGVKHGIENGYYHSGVIEYQEEYVEGNRVSRNSYDEAGELKFKHTSKPSSAA